MGQELIEDIILRHSQRGMLTLREEMPDRFCELAAKEILSWPHGTVFLTTGFYVAGFAETDGPAGTVAVAEALQKLGFHPIIVTDSFCDGFFELRGLEALYMPIDADKEYCARMIRRYHPVGMISIERCGINTRGDYENMRGISIKEHTSPVDLFFKQAPVFGIPTIGVGDGGNEIGMGNVKEVIAQKLSLVPCAVCVDYLVIASVSNWGAYGIAAYLQKLTGEPVAADPDDILSYIEKTVEIGSVDGVTHERVAHVDGYESGVEREILEALAEVSYGTVYKSRGLHACR